MGRKNKSQEDDFEFFQVNDTRHREEEEEFHLYEEEEVSSPPKKKQKKKKERKRKNVGHTNDDFYDVTVNDEHYFLSEEDRIELEKKRVYKKIRTITIITLYVLFLIVGVITTTYDKEKVPQKVDVTLRESRNEFLMVENHFEKQLAVIYEITKLDEKVSESGAENSFMYAVNYKDYGGMIEANVKEVQGAKYSPDYAFMRDINVVIYDNLYKYASMMSNGLSSQNMSYIQEAQKYKSNYNTAFEKYYSNLEQFRALVGLEEE